MKLLFCTTILLLLSLNLAYITIPLSPSPKKSHSKSHHDLSKFHDNTLFTTLTQPLLNSFDTELFGTISLGTPAQEFSVIFDSGSSNIVIPGEECLKESCEGKRRFHHSNSNTYHGTKSQFTLQYDSGVATGTLASDIMKISGLAIENMAFIEAETMQDFKDNKDYDGIIGLAFPESSEGGIPTFFEALIAQKVIQDESFSLYISGNKSAVVIGGVNSEYSMGKWTYFSIIDDGLWTVSVTSIDLGGIKLGLNDVTACFDSGTSLILMPNGMLQLIKRRLKIDEDTVVDIRDLPLLPTIKFNAGGNDIVISPEIYMVCMNGSCVLGIRADRNPRSREITLGDVFLRGYYTHFDFGKKRIGLSLPNKNL